MTKKEKKAQNKFALMSDKTGDYLTIEEVKKGLVHIEVGHSCIVELNYIVPLEFITGFISEALYKEAMKPEDIAKQLFTYHHKGKLDKKFNEKLLSQVQRYSIWLDKNFKIKEPNWIINRYCFKCKKVTKFYYCNNCGKYFCSEHCEWEEPEYGEFGSILCDEQPIHALCV